MQYLVQVPTAKRICEIMHERDIYEELCIEVRALVGNSDLADECMDYMLHSLICDHLGIIPQIELDLVMALGKIRAALVKNRCIHFYFEETTICEYLRASTHARNFKHSVVGRCIRHTQHAMLVQEDLLLNDEERLWQI